MERSSIEQTVERVVSQVLDNHVPRLRQELVQRVLQDLEPQAGSLGEASASNLLKAISSIHAGTTQREILRALLDNAVRYSGRCALFVVKGSSATGWQGRAFHNNDALKDFTLDIDSGVAARALQGRIAVAGTAAEMDSRFISQFGAPAHDSLIVLPLLLKEKVAALVYADAGAEPVGKLEGAALELLVVATSAWLEVAALRRQSLKEGADAAASEKSEQAAAAHATPSHSDPFAAHAPIHSASHTEPVAADPVPLPVPEPAASEPAPVPEISEPVPGLSAEDSELHRKAQRFAKLLVDEIKLYNQAKVAEGRKSKDLYDRLKEDIDKSRSTFQKRYGNTVASSADYFTAELVRSLAEDDGSLMGANFRR